MAMEIRKTNICNDCGAEFTRGRGRPPKDPKAVICSECRAGNAKHIEDIKKSKMSIKKISADMDEQPSIKEPDNSKRVIGATQAAVTEPCPNCSYAYADGGYCESCGWNRPVNRLPYGTATGKVRRK